MLYNYLPSRTTPPNLGVKIPGSSQHTHAGWCLTCLSHSAMGLLVLIYTWVGWSLVNLRQGNAQPKPAQCWTWLVLNPWPLTHELRMVPQHHQGWLWLVVVQYLQVLDWLYWGCDPCLPLGILALTRMSLMNLGYINVTIMSLLVSGLVTLDLSHIGQCSEIICFIGGFPLLYVVFNIKEVSSIS